MWGLIRKDLGEFVSTIKDDAAGTIMSAMSLGAEEEYESSYDSSSVDGEPRERQLASAAVRALRADIKTYTEDVCESESERYAAFSARFDLGARTKDVATLLKEDPVVTKIHTQLVPEHLSYEDFWSRYFFRSERVAEGKGGGGMSFPCDGEEEDDDFGWGDDQEDDDHDLDVDDSSVSSLRAGATTVGGPAGPAAGGALGAMQVPSASPEAGAAAAASAAADSVGRTLGSSSVAGAIGVGEVGDGGGPLLEQASGASGSRSGPGMAAAGAAGVAGVALSPSTTPGGEVKSLAPTAAAAEIARLTEALRLCELERASLSEKLAGVGRGSGDAMGDESLVAELRRERDTAKAEAVDLRERLQQAEEGRAEALARATAATAAGADDATATAGNADATVSASPTRLQELSNALAASEARASAAERDAEAQAVARVAAEERAATAATAAAAAAGADAGAAAARVSDAGRDGPACGDWESEAAAATAAAAAADLAVEEAEREILRLKRACREERAKHEAMLLASREAANEAVEAALSSADADREEACAEVAAAMRAEAERKDEELEALRGQLAKSAEAMEEAGTLRADIEELRRVVESEKEAATRAASEARQEADAVKQLREEIRVLQAAADRPRASTAAGRGGGPGAIGGTHRRGATHRSDAGGEDTDGWGEDEDDSCCAASTNSSGVVVERPLSATSPLAGDETRQHGHGTDRVGAVGGGGGSGPSDGGGGGGGSGGGGGGGDSGSQIGDGERPLVSPGVRGGAGGVRRGGAAGGGDGEVEGEGDDGWEGWD